MVAAQDIIRRCESLGFALAGIAPAKPTDRRDELVRWLAEGKHGSMEWLTRNTEQRMDPRQLVQGARSIIMVADVYASPSAPRHRDTSTPSGRIARYAQGADYHEAMKERLHQLCDALRAEHPAEQFRAFVDTAPVLEREHAARAGLGWIGKHTLLIHPDIGSYLFLGGVITTLDVAPPPEQRPMPDHCGTCTRCIDACPTHAITPYSIDARRCISFLTIEHRGPIDPEFHEPIGDWIFGCDICQEVCPHNRERPWNPDRKGGGSPAAAPNPSYSPRRASIDLLEVLNWTEDDRRRALSGSSLKRAKLDMWKRNALIVAANALRVRRNPDLLNTIERLLNEPSQSAVVRNAARQSLESLAR